MSANYSEFIPTKKIDITSMFTAFERRCDKDYYFEGESHNFWEMVCVLEGSLGVTADDDVYSLCAGQMILHKPMEFHRLWADGNTTPLVCIFSFSAQVMPTLGGRVYRMSANDQKRVKNLLENFHEHYEMESDDDALNMHFKCVRPTFECAAYADICYLEYMILKMVSQGADLGVADASPTARKYVEIIGVMENNIDKRLSIDDIADMCNMSVSNVKKVFYRYSGKGIAGYFNELKIRHALKMLDDGMGINDISQALGFDDRNYFSTVFKRITGQSPAKYKKENLRGE